MHIISIMLEELWLLLKGFSLMTFVLTLYNFSLWYQISSSSSGTGASICKSSLERLRILRRETISPLLLGPQLKNKNKNWIFPPIFDKVNKYNAFERFSHLFRGKLLALLLTSISWLSTHCQVFFLKYYKCNFGIFVGKIVEFQKCGRNLSRDDEKAIYIPFMQQQVSIKAINATEKIT